MSRDILMSISSNNYNMIRNSIAKLLKIEPSFLPSYYLATKHWVPLILGEIEYTEKYLHMLLKSKRDKIVVSNDPDDYHR